jgi:hypothetical protein
MRLAVFISKRHRASRGFGWRALVTLSPNELGVIGMYGISRAAMSCAASGGHTVKPVTEEDF